MTDRPAPTGWCPEHGPVVARLYFDRPYWCPTCPRIACGPGADAALARLAEAEGARQALIVALEGEPADGLPALAVAACAVIRAGSVTRAFDCLRDLRDRINAPTAREALEAAERAAAEGRGPARLLAEYAATWLRDWLARRVAP